MSAYLAVGQTHYVCAGELSVAFELCKRKGGHRITVWRLPVGTTRWGFIEGVPCTNVGPAVEVLRC